MSLQSPDIVIYDGYSNGPVTVKPASTAAVAADSALVVTVSPNSVAVTANQGTANTLGNAWPIKMTDGYGNLFGSSANPIVTSGSVVTDKSTAITGNAPSSVAQSATSVTILAANANRVGATFYNNANSKLYLAMGTGSASTTLFSLVVAPNSFFELPVSYTGAIAGIWAAAGSGTALVTEFVL